MDQPAGGLGGVVGWLNTKKFDETGDEVKSQGWTPLIIDTNGNGKRDAYVEPRSRSIRPRTSGSMAAFYGMQPSPVDDSIWGQAMDVGFSRMDQPGYIVRARPGPDPANTALAEVYLAAGRRVRFARHRHRPRRRGVDAVCERHIGKLRPPQVQGSAQRTDGGDRQAVSGRLDALPDARTAVQGRG